MHYDLGQQWKWIKRSIPFQTLLKKKKKKTNKTLPVLQMNTYQRG